MLTGLFSIAKPLIHALDPETAHLMAIKALRFAPLPAPPPDDPRLAVTAFGLTFPNPVGLAAGFDKHAEVPDAALRLGFGFVEVGGVTPNPQPGNARPRVFRLADDEAVINRYGLNSDGMDRVRERLQQRSRVGTVGINIGPNKASSDRIADYVSLVKGLGPVADYLSINVSSPNTPGLRDLQSRKVLDDLTALILDARDGLPGARVPVLLKIAPDISESELDDIVAVARSRRVDGMIVSNTTVARPDSLKEKQMARETGGLSGKPLFVASTRILAQTYLRVENQFPLVGVGGIDSAETAWAKVQAGASLLQLYTALIYKGHGLIADIKKGLLARLEQEGLTSPIQAAGTDAKTWAHAT